MRTTGFRGVRLPMNQSVAFDLAKLLGSVGSEAFFREHWERQPLALARNNPRYYDGLFSRRDLDSVIALTHPRFVDPDHLRDRNFVQGWLPDDEPFSGYYPDLPTVHRSYAHGKTVIIKAMHHRWPAVAAMCRDLEAIFDCPVHTNLYLTPCGAQGFDAHYDTHEVFVLQIDGEKHWRLYGAARELPLPDEAVTIAKDQLGSPTQEVLLQPGDLLYLPRGHVHEAFTSERSSLHLTVGVNVRRWVELLQQAIASAGAGDVRLRETLPLGLFSTAATQPGLKAKFRELLELVARTASLEDAAAASTDAFMSKLASLPHDHFAVVDANRIDLDTMVERAPGQIFRVVQNGESVTLRAPGGRIEGPAKIVRAMRFIAETQRFAPRDLPDTLTERAKLVLVQRLIREKLLTVVAAPANGTGEPSAEGPQAALEL
jgi:hypothetical protein